MTTPPREPLFLERQTYRRRRLMDAARFLPFVGGFLLVVPVVWAGTSMTTSGTLYIFGLWLLLIVVAGLLSRRLKTRIDDTEIDDGDG